MKNKLKTDYLCRVNIDSFQFSLYVNNTNKKSNITNITKVTKILNVYYNFANTIDFIKKSDIINNNLMVFIQIEGNPV